MEQKRGIAEIEKVKLDENEYAIGVSIPIRWGVDENGSEYEVSTNTRTKAFRCFMNQCVGSPNLTIFTCKEKRDERYEKGKQILQNAHYEVIEK